MRVWPTGSAEANSRAQANGQQNGQSRLEENRVRQGKRRNIRSHDEQLDETSLKFTWV